MGVIYEPRGKAREYCELAANLYKGCDHGCAYCYAPAATYRTRQEFIQPILRDDVIVHIRKEAANYAGREVLLCFTCDPYSSFAAGTGVTRQAIKALHEGGARVVILTKGGLRSAGDFDLLKSGDKYGQTLTFLGNEESLLWEPGAALPMDRMEALKIAKRRSLFTWVSLEPVIDPRQAIEWIRKTKELVDFYKVGRWNYDARANEIDWAGFAKKVKKLLDRIGVPYLLKSDLAKYLPTGA